MILLSLAGVTKHFGPDPVLDGVTFDIRPGEKIGLVGPNGTGKTTLLKILSGLETADGGNIQRHPSIRLGYLQQQPDFVGPRTVWQEAAEALAHLSDLSAELERVGHLIAEAEEEDERRKWGARFDALQQEIHSKDAFQIEHRIERVLGGLSFGPESYEQPVDQLSGGQQNRLLLAKLLLAAPDVMLLDEPSNHLDIEATEWLEDYLLAVSSALLIVSHDRYLLDKIATRTLELFQGTVDSYRGNFTAYWQQKQERLEIQRRTYERQQAEISKMEEFVRRNHYGQKHTQAEDRRKKLARIERVAPPREISVAPMSFRVSRRCGDIALRAERLAKSFDKPLFAGLSFDIQRGERWGIFGGNGTGKTTLLRCLLGDEPLDEGAVVFGTGIQVGYFDQRLASVADDCQVVDAIRPSHKEFTEPQRRDLLARFGITGEMVFQQVHSLSGGERNRVALARLAALEANLLVLDEPTNHLDLWARDALEKALRGFEGTVLFVSHDRYFLNQVADHLLVAERGRFRVIEGNYDLYSHLVSQEPSAVRGKASGQASAAAGDRPAGETQNGSSPSAAKSKTAPLTRRKRRFPYRKVADLEAEIHQQEESLEHLQARLSSLEVLRSGELVKSTRAEIQARQNALALLYEHWEEAAELN